MKLSFSTLSCPEWSWDKIVREAARLGFGGIEVRGVAGEMLLPKVEVFRPENLENTMKQLKKEGLEIPILDTSCRFHEAGDFDKYLEEGRMTIDLANKMGVKYIRVFGDKIPNPEKKDEIISSIIRGLNALCDYAAGKKVTVLLETHGDFASLETLWPIIEGVRSLQFGILWDIEHTFKVYGEDVKEFFEKVRPLIKHVHVKDARRLDKEFKLCEIGAGDVPIKKVIDVLKSVNYEGYLSLEWEKKWKPELDEPEIAIPAYKEYMDELLKQD